MLDLAGDSGLVPASSRGARGPFIGQALPARVPRRWAREAGLERLLRELHVGFGYQTWWPARTPFEVIVGAILTQNTAWTNVELALARLHALGPLTPGRLLRMSAEKLAEAVRPSGYYNAKARKLQCVSEWYLKTGGLEALRERPLAPLRTSLLEVWGVGPETADSILCYAAGRRTAVVDTYTRRILGRHGLVDAELPYEELRAWLEARLVRSQFVFEEFHALFVRVGYHHCKPSPACEACPVRTP